MTTPRKIFAAVALAAVAMFGTAGLALAGPNHVDDGGHHGGHSNSHADNYHFGDDNDCNYKYNRDGSRNHKFDGGNKDCPTRYPVTNPPNIPNEDSPAGGGGLLPGL
jgi:hypothetical protein